MVKVQPDFVTQIQPGKEPRLKRYTGPLTGCVFDEMCDEFRTALISSKVDEIDKLTQRVKARNYKVDLKVFALCYQAIEKATVPNKLNEARDILHMALEMIEKEESPNKSLLRGKVYRILAGIPRRKGKFRTAMKHVREARRACIDAAPCCETACILLEETLILQLENKVSTRQEEIEDKLETALKQSRVCPDQRRGKYTVSLVYLRKALFHLHSYTCWKDENDRPEESYIRKAEECLEQVDCRIIDGSNAYKLEYYIANSDLHRHRAYSESDQPKFREHITKALEFAEKAKLIQEDAKFADDSYLHVKKKIKLLKCIN